MRNAFSIAAGASSDTRKPRVVLISRLKLMRPSPIVTGSISLRIRAILGSRHLKEIFRSKPTRRSGGSEITNWTSVPARTPIAYAYSSSGPSKKPRSPTIPAMIVRFQTSGASAGIVKWS